MAKKKPKYAQVQIYSSKEQISKSSSKSTVIWWSLLIALFLIPSIYFIIDENWHRNYYLENLQVCGATVAELSTENGKYYIRVSLNENAPKDYIPEENRWIQVQQDFYQNHIVGESVGVLIGQYDVFKSRLFGSGQKFDKTVWGIEEIYTSYKDAQEANPYKKYNAKAVIAKKKTTKDGKNFFVLNTQERNFSLEVSKEIYDKYELNKEVECEFESIGESLKCIRVIG